MIAARSAFYHLPFTIDHLPSHCALNSATGNQVSGYDRQFTYDQRMSLGIEPPYFPTVTNDGVRDVIVFSYGQREQIY